MEYPPGPTPSGTVEERPPTFTHVDFRTMVLVFEGAPRPFPSYTFSNGRELWPESDRQT